MRSSQIGSVFFISLFSLSGQVFCQDILYKKDSTPVKVDITDFNGKTVTYKIPGEPDGNNHYISKSTLDSLTYRDGKSLRFTFENKAQLPAMIKRSYLGVEIINITKGIPDISFERISKNGRTSYVAEVFINSKRDENIYSYGNGIFEYTNFNAYYFFTRVGINFYPFNYSIARAGDFRFSDGLSVLMGSCSKMDYDVYQEKRAFAATLIGNMEARIYLGKYLQLQGGAKISVLPLLTYLIPEVGFSIGF